MADKLVVAILGATGVVGTQMIQCLEERDFPVERLVPLASARSAGKTVRFNGEDVTVLEATPDAFEGVDIVLGAAGDAQAKELLPEAAARGAVCVDNSHAFRLDADVPLAIPEINPEDIANHPRNIIANPNCATIIGLVPTWPLAQRAGLKRLIVSTYQAASGAGMPGLKELERESRVLAEGGEVGDTAPFAYQLAFNLIPQIGGFKEEAYTSEELKMQNEGRKHRRVRAPHHAGRGARGAVRGARRQGRGRPREPALPHAARHLRPGPGVRGPHPPRPFRAGRRERAHVLVLRRPDSQGRRDQRGADRGAPAVTPAPRL